MRPCAASNRHERLVVHVTPIKDASARNPGAHTDPPPPARRGSRRRRALRLRSAVRRLGRP
eukprot:1479296-Pleurochrysis_carterae.AAC.1